MFRMTIKILLVAVMSGAATAQNDTVLAALFNTTTPSSALQPMIVNQSMTIDTDVTPMPLEVLSFTLDIGATLTVVGSRPFHVKSNLDIFIFGTLDCSGRSGDMGGAGGPGAFDGGSGGNAGQGPHGGRPATGNGSGGGGGNRTAGMAGSGPGAGGASTFGGPGLFETPLTPGSGGGPSTIPASIGGGGGGVVRLHANGRIFLGGSILARGGRGGELAGPFLAARAAGGGAGGAIELVSPLVQGSASTISAEGGVGGDGIFEDGGDGGDGVIIVRAGSLSSTFGMAPTPMVFGYGATLTPSCPSADILVQPDFFDFPAVIGAQAFILFSGVQVPAGQGIPLGGGNELLLDTTDALFDPVTSPLYPLLLGQGNVISGFGGQAVITVDFAPLVPALASLGLESFTVFVQALLIQNGAVFDASNVLNVDYLGD